MTSITVSRCWLIATVTRQNLIRRRHHQRLVQLTITVKDVFTPKTKGKRIIKTHTVEGQRMLERIGGFMGEVGQIVRSHHERWDGDGYPDGLAGEQIPLEARIIACCDSWSAMRTDRSYRKALSYEVARAEIVANSGRQFDPRVAEAFLRIVEHSGERDLPAPAVPESGYGSVEPLVETAAH